MTAPERLVGQQESGRGLSPSCPGRCYGRVGLPSSRLNHTLDSVISLSICFFRAGFFFFLDHNSNYVQLSYLCTCLTQVLRERQTDGTYLYNTTVRHHDNILSTNLQIEREREIHCWDTSWSSFLKYIHQCSLSLGKLYWMISLYIFAIDFYGIF